MNQNVDKINKEYAELSKIKTIAKILARHYSIGRVYKCACDYPHCSELGCYHWWFMFLSDPDKITKMKNLYDSASVIMEK